VLVAGDGKAARTGEREIWFEGGWRATRFYNRELLRPGDVIAGPAMITEYTAATLVLPGCAARVDRLGNLAIEIDPEGIGEEASA
jgi:N-methylhydantoinase A